MNLSDDSKKIREILALRASGWSIMALSIKYTRDRTSIRHHLVKYSVVPLTTVVDVRIERPPRIEQKAPAHKYDYLFDEPVNKGKNYREYIDEANRRHPNERKRKVPTGQHKMSDILVDVVY